jgi:hypothetical protein
MAKIAEINQAGLNEWLQDRPDCIINMVKQYPPDVLYRMKSTGQRVTIVAYAENGTVRVLVSGDFNAIILDREVFGVSLEDLEECDLPDSNERLGTLLKTEEEINWYFEDRTAISEHRHEKAI